MSHSIFFGILSVIVIMMIFGKRNYLLGAITITALLAHLSFDIFVDKYSEFPIFTPFYNSMIHFQSTNWVLLEIVAVIITGSATIIQRKQDSKPQIS